MKHSLHWALIALIALVLCYMGPGPAIARTGEPILTDGQIEKLRSLPLGVSKQPSLILRSRHINDITFSGAGGGSRYGYVTEKGIVKDGFWLQLNNEGNESWSNTGIVFGPDFDVTKYNTLVLWIRALSDGPKFFVTLHDDQWTSKIKPQARSAVLAPPQFASGDIVQVVIPFKTLDIQKRVSYSRLHRLGLEFGRKTVGNKSGPVMDILGLAFIDHSRHPDRVAYVKLDSTVIYEAMRRVSAPTMDTAPSPFSPGPVKKAVKNDVTPILDEPIKKPTISLTSINEKKLPIPVSGYEVQPPIVSSFDTITEIKSTASYLTSARAGTEKLLLSNWPFLAAAVTGLIVFVLHLRRKKRKSHKNIGSLIHRLSWTLLAEELAQGLKIERLFWKRLSEKKIAFAWMSPYQSNIERISSDEYHGETFMRRQVKLAERAGIRLFPSLCFVRSLFHFESFLSKPELFLTKTIPPSEIHLSDEELRVRYIGFFPVWIPPYWQKQHNLPQKLLLAYGKLPGSMATSDSVQFNLRSPELRRLAIRVLDRMAQVGQGVRIEGAMALLNSSLNLYWGEHLSESESTKESEFWFEVIGIIKAQHPHFMFIADGCGPYGQKLRELGFDYLENDHLMQTLANQIRLEEVGNLESALSPEGAVILPTSIYDVSALFRGSNSGSLQRQKSVLGAMVVGFLPGTIQHDGQIPAELNKFYNLISKWPAFRYGKFVLLKTSSPEIFAFARWEKRVIYIVVVNLSMARKMVSVKLDPFQARVEPNKIYLFNDALHGSRFFSELKVDTSQPPAVAVLGQDVRESGLSISMSELSLRLFSVNLGSPIQHEIPSEIRQLYKA